MNIRYINEQAGNPKSGGDIAEDTAFNGILDNIPSTYLRVYSGIVDLVNPRRVWTDRLQETFPTIYDYQELKVELVILS